MTESPNSLLWAVGETLLVLFFVQFLLLLHHYLCEKTLHKARKLFPRIMTSLMPLGVDTRSLLPRVVPVTTSDYWYRVRCPRHLLIRRGSAAEILDWLDRTKKD
jgi:hypothetical protein